MMKNVLIRQPSVVYDDVEIGEGTKTGHFVLIRSKTKIGKNCTIGTATIIEGGDVVIGNNVSIQSRCYMPQQTKIEDNVFMGPGVVITNDKYPPTEDPSKWRPVTIKKGARIGANVTILPGVTIGENALIGAGSVVTKDIPAGKTAYGNPARVVEK